MAERVQLSRKKGWKMPENTVKVARPGPWGNPFIVNPRVKAGGGSGAAYICVPTVEDAILAYREMLETPAEPGQRAHELRARLPELRGKNLACWCRLDQPCHADVLLELANSPRCSAMRRAATWGVASNARGVSSTWISVLGIAYHAPLTP